MSLLLPPITLHAADRMFPLKLATKVRKKFTIMDVVASTSAFIFTRHDAKQVLTYGN